MSNSPPSFPSFAAAEAFCSGLGLSLSDGEPLVTSIVQSTSFARGAIGSTCEHQYSRCSNPTVSALEKALGELEGALPAVSFSTGLAAETALFLSLLSAGDHVVCGSSVYGGTTRLLRQVLAPLGIEPIFVDTTDLDAVRKSLRINTKLFFAETPANPSLEITDLRALATLCREHGALLAVDNTFLTPVLQRPLDLGADIAVYSTTKFIEGHSTALGGTLVTRNPYLLQRFQFIRKCTGAIQTPFGAWVTLQGLRTLPLRIERQSANACQVAERLAQHPAVTQVYYPTLADERSRAIAARQHLGAHGAVVTFELRTLGEARAVAAGVRRCRLAEHVGSVETLLTHPATMTHADVPADQRRVAGISDGLLRLSVGLEPVSVIIADLEQALAGSVTHATGGSAARELAAAGST